MSSQPRVSLTAGPATAASTRTAAAADARRRMLALLTVLALAATLMVTSAHPAAAAGVSGTDASQFLKLVNQERARRGLGSLRSHGELAGIGGGHSRRMGSNADGVCSIEKGTLYHRNPISGGIDAPWIKLAENVGCHPGASHLSASQRVTDLHKALMDSPGHRANILHRDMRYLGIGAYRDSHGGLWVTQIFMDMKQRTTSPKPAPKPAPEPAPTPTASPRPAPTPTATPEPAPEPTPQPRIRQAQRRLAALGFYDGPADGFYGAGTRTAVRAFQKAARLTVDGILGPNTTAALHAADAPDNRPERQRRRPAAKRDDTPAPAPAAPSRPVPPASAGTPGLDVMMASVGLIGEATQVDAALARLSGLVGIARSLWQLLAG